MNEADPRPLAAHPQPVHRLFSVHGVELEYAIVDAESLDVRPLAEELFHAVEGEWASDHDDGPVGWSNELVAHQLELKTARPVATLAEARPGLVASVGRVHAALAPLGARLLPTGMHPWMEPRRETQLWSREGHEIYEAYHAIFDCHRHGWANVQSVHLNLPFGDEEEFARLLMACRVLLPLLPAIAASTPFVEGRITGLLDSRVDFYRTNSARVPSMAGDVIPEAVHDVAAYRREVLGRIERELREHREGTVLAGNEWTNARGAIARFDRSAIEVRLLDSQECVLSDLAICALVTAVLQNLVEADVERLAAYPGDVLVRLLAATAAQGRRASVQDRDYLGLFGISRSSCTAGELWYALAERGFEGCSGPFGQAIDLILDRGTLAERMLLSTGPAPEHQALHRLYGQLADCLVEDRPFLP